MDIYRTNFYQKNQQKILSVTSIYVILLLTSIILQPPFIFFSFFPNYYKLAIALLLMILSGILFFKKTIKCNYFFLFYILINLLYFCFLLLDPINYKYVISDTRQLIALGLCYLFLVNVLKNINYINLYVKFMAFLSAINTIGYLLMSLNLLKPFSEFTSAFVVDQDVFYNYGFFVVQKKLVTELSGFTISRTCGYFDEPGTFGFYITIAIILYHLFFSKNSKNKVIELILLLAGFTTFSLAFYVSITIFYSFLFLDAKTILNPVLFILKKKWSWLHLLFFLLIIILSITIYNIMSGNEVFWQYFQGKILNRLEFTGDEQIIAGNNRASGLTVGLELFLQNIWFGWGLGYSQEHLRSQFDFASLAGPLVQYGLIGTIFIIHLPFFRGVLQLLCSLKKDFIAAGIVLILNFCQRPFNFTDPLILLSLLFIVNYFSSKKRLIKL